MSGCIGDSFLDSRLDQLSLDNAAVSSGDTSFQDCHESTMENLESADNSFTTLRSSTSASPMLLPGRVDSRQRTRTTAEMSPNDSQDDDADEADASNSPVQHNNSAAQASPIVTTDLMPKGVHYPMRPPHMNLMGRFVRRGNGRGGGTHWSIGRPTPQQSCDPNVSAYQYPLLYVSPAGTISVLLKNDIIVELTIDKALRVTSPGRFAAATNGRGSASCIMHTQARIYQEDAKVFSQFGNDKLAVFGSQGVLFTMRRLTQAYLVSATNIGGTTAIPLSCIQFPTLESDFTLTLFYMQSQFGERCVQLCQEMVHSAHYESRPDGTLVVHINGIYIRQDTLGRVDVNNRPRHISINPVDSSVHLRTHSVDMFIQEDEKAYVKRGEKRMHVSKSGMVVSDANCITSMDHFGRIVSST